MTGLVAGVIGLDQGSSLKTPGDTLPPPGPGFRAATPCSSYYGQKTAADLPAAPDGKRAPYVVCGYEPQQYQSAYGVSDQIKRGLDGRSVTVAITRSTTASSARRPCPTSRRRRSRSTRLGRTT